MKVGFIGAGRMATALCRGFISSGENSAFSIHSIVRRKRERAQDDATLIQVAEHLLIRLRSVWNFLLLPTMGKIRDLIAM